MRHSDVTRILAIAMWALIAWFAIGEIARIASVTLYPGAAIAGLVAGLVLPRITGLVAFTAGVAVSYPIAFVLGRIVYLGEAWFELTMLLLLISWAGFTVGAILRRGSTPLGRAV
jgi:hypothetical protein